METTMNVCYNKAVEINGVEVTQNGDIFIAHLPNKINVFFKVEYRNGIYVKCTGYWDIVKNRSYQAERYLYKYTTLCQSLGFELLKQNFIWDYDRQQIALKSYKAQMKDYYNKCLEKGLSVDKWLVDLMNDPKF